MSRYWRLWFVRYYCRHIFSCLICVWFYLLLDYSQNGKSICDVVDDVQFNRNDNNNRSGKMELGRKLYWRHLVPGGICSICGWNLAARCTEPFSFAASWQYGYINYLLESQVHFRSSNIKKIHNFLIANNHLLFSSCSPTLFHSEKFEENSQENCLSP